MSGEAASEGIEKKGSGDGRGVKRSGKVLGGDMSLRGRGCWGGRKAQISFKRWQMTSGTNILSEVADDFNTFSSHYLHHHHDHHQPVGFQCPT